MDNNLSYNDYNEQNNFSEFCDASGRSVQFVTSQMRIISSFFFLSKDLSRLIAASSILSPTQEEFLLFQQFLRTFWEVQK